MPINPMVVNERAMFKRGQRFPLIRQLRSIMDDIESMLWFAVFPGGFTCR
jgi:hypothetical protein